MPEQRRYLRFSVLYRIEHWVLTASFGLLALTGLVQEYADAAFADWIIGVLGGIETVRVIHHIAAIVLMFETIYHIGALGYKFFVLKVRPSMLPGKKDLINAIQALKYNLGLSKKRAMQGHFTFEEKLEYLAVVWGTILMGVTGFILWNPIASTRILPGELVPAAKMAHGLEALLAVLAIILWHMYHVHLRHLNLSMFNGHLTEEEMEDEHPAELAAIKAGKVYTPPSPSEIAWRRRIYFPAYAGLAAIMLAGVWFFVGYEQTAIATLPPAEIVSVYSPLTPTPLPTAKPTSLPPTPAPTSPASAAGPEATTTVSAEAKAVGWNTAISDMMAAKCVSCHGSSTKMGGLDLSTYQAALQGGVSGAAVVPGEAPASLIFTRQASGGHPGQLSPDELATLQHWLESGAPEQASTASAPASSTAAPGTAASVTWQANIAELLKTKCGMCHSQANPMGGLDTSSYASTVKGGANGAGIVPGDPQASLLVTRQSQGNHPGQLSEEELQLLVEWITAGAAEN